MLLYFLLDIDSIIPEFCDTILVYMRYRCLSFSPGLINHLLIQSKYVGKDLDVFFGGSRRAIGVLLR